MRAVGGIVVLALWVGVPCVAGLIARGKGRSFALWFIATLVLWPFPLLVVLFVPSKRPPPPGIAEPPAAAPPSQPISAAESSRSLASQAFAQREE